MFIKFIAGFNLMAPGKKSSSSSSKMLKPTAKRGKTDGMSIESLPKELITMILALIASESLTDLFNVKLSCKYLLQLSEDDSVFEKASVDKFDGWNMNKVSGFLKRCEESGNPEWLFRLGVYEYFSKSNIDYGLNCLKRASDKGHIEASYVYSIILICSGDKSKEYGLKLLASLKRFRTQEFREKIRKKFRWMWIRNMITVDIEKEEKCFNVRRCDCLKNWKGGQWEGEDAAAPCCDPCFCYREVKFFYELIWSKYQFK